MDAPKVEDPSIVGNIGVPWITFFDTVGDIRMYRGCHEFLKNKVPWATSMSPTVPKNVIHGTSKCHPRYATHGTYFMYRG